MMSWCQHDDLMVYEYEKQSGDCAPDRRVFFSCYSVHEYDSMAGINQATFNVINDVFCHLSCMTDTFMIIRP